MRGFHCSACGEHGITNTPMHLLLKHGDDSSTKIVFTPEEWDENKD